MDYKHREILRSYWDKFRQELEPGKLIPKLVKLLDATDEQELMSMPTRESAVDKLFDKLPRKGPEAFGIFVQALQKTQSFLATLLKNAELEAELEIERTSTASLKSEAREVRKAFEKEKEEHKKTQERLEVLKSRHEGLMASTETYEKDTFDTTQWRRARVTEIHVLSIYKDVSELWRELGTLLDLPPAEIRNLENECRSSSERAWKVMERWLQMKGSKATLGILTDALEEIGLRSVVEMLMEKIKQVGVSKAEVEKLSEQVKDVTFKLECLQKKSDETEKEKEEQKSKLDAKEQEVAELKDQLERVSEELTRKNDELRKYSESGGSEVI